jgi:hypothetical protein
MSSNPVSHKSEHIPEERQAQALYDFLKGLLPHDDPNVPADEAALGKALQALAEEIRPDEQFDANLQEILHTETRRVRSRAAFGNFGRMLGLAAAVLALLVGLGWAIRTLLPQPAVLGTATMNNPEIATATLTEPEIATATPGDCTPASYVVVQGDTLNKIAMDFSVSVETILAANSMTEASALAVGQVLAIPRCLPEAATPVPTQSAAALKTYTSPMMPDMEIVMQAEFPESPPEVQIYEQTPWEKITLDAARQAASLLGLPGAAFEPTRSNPWDSIFIFTDGFRRVEYTNSIYQYVYNADYSAVRNGNPEKSLTTDQVAEIEAFLKERGLLEFAYQIEEPPYAPPPGGVVFQQLLDDMAIHFSGFSGPQIAVQVDAEGKVRTVDGYRINYQPIGNYKIRTAEEAWDKAISPELPMGVELNMLSQTHFPGFWQRMYPMGQRVEFFGYLEILKPMEAGGTAQLFLENVPLRGNVQGMAQLGDATQVIQAWGQFQQGETGERVFEVEGWQVSPLPSESIIGFIERDGEKAYLTASDRKLRVPDLPDGVADGTQVSMTGVVLQDAEPVLDWNWLYTEPMGSGGGGGGISFLELNLSGPPAPTPTPYPLPTAQAGQRLEGVTGNPNVTIREYADGSRKVEVDMYIAPTDEWPDGISLRLEGPALEGIEAYHMLPVRIWGTLTGKTVGVIVYMNLERYEPVYPGVKMQAWLGKFQVATLESKKVLLFTAQDGQQYILNTSLTDETSIQWMPVGEAMVVEGVVFPDKTFAGYPILQDYRFLPAGGIQDISQYKMQMVVPQVVKEAGSASLPRQAVIEKIELVYHTLDLRNGYENPSGTVYIQPMWRFVGHYPDGSYFEFLVQALLDEYLKAGEE